MAEPELKALGLRRKGAKLEKIARKKDTQPRLERKTPEEREAYYKEQVAKAEAAGTLPVIDETGEILPSLDELASKYQKKFDFWETAGFQPKQLEAANAVMSHKYILYGGAAGGGKSYFLRWIAIFLLGYYYNKYKQPGIRIGLFCEDYPALKERHLSKVEFEFPSWLGTLNKSDAEFKLHPQFGSGVITFLNLDDPKKYMSSEFASVLVDELTKDPREVFDYLAFMRLRWKGISSEDTKFIGASNPGGPGHGWVKSLWINRDQASWPKMDFRKVAYVRALYSDNKFIDEGYGDQLSSMSDDLAKAYRDGNWDIFAGQYFTEWNRDVHVIEPMTDPVTLEMFNKLPVWAGLDYGYTNPSAIVFGRFWEDTWYIFDEIYVRNHTYEELRDAIIAKGYNPELVFADPAIWAKKDSPTSGADKMSPLPMRQALNERIIGWNIIREHLKTNTIKIYNTCANLIRTLPDMVYREKDGVYIEDMDTRGDDHVMDALRYLCFSHKNIIQQKGVLTYTGGQPHTDSDFEELFRPENEHPALYTMGFTTRPSYNGK